MPSAQGAADCNLRSGFESLVSARHVMGPAELEAHDANLMNGPVNGRTSGVHQLRFGNL
jgi:hypothetical protein